MVSAVVPPACLTERITSSERNATTFRSAFRSENLCDSRGCERKNGISRIFSKVFQAAQIVAAFAATKITPQQNFSFPLKKMCGVAAFEPFFRKILEVVTEELIELWLSHYLPLSACGQSYRFNRVVFFNIDKVCNAVTHPHAQCFYPVVLLSLELIDRRSGQLSAI